MRALLLAAALLLSGPPAGMPPVRGAAPSQPPRPLQPPPPSPPTQPLRGFEGQWVLDARRCEFGGTMGVLRAREDDVAVDGERLTVRSRYVRASGDTVSLDYVYRADGDASNSMRGQTVQTRGRHAGNALEFVSVIKLLLLELKSEERWTLAARGDTLVMERTARSPLGNQHQVLYFGHSARGR